MKARAWRRRAAPDMYRRAAIYEAATGVADRQLPDCDAARKNAAEIAVPITRADPEHRRAPPKGGGNPLQRSLPALVNETTTRCADGLTHLDMAVHAREIWAR